MEERQQIVHELHDGIQQDLTALSLFAGMLQLDARHLTAAHASRAEAEELAATLERVQDGVDRLVAGLADAQRHVTELAQRIMPTPVDVESAQMSKDSNRD